MKRITPNCSRLTCKFEFDGAELATDNEATAKGSSASGTTASLEPTTHSDASPQYSIGVISLLLAGTVLTVGAVVHLRRTSSDSLNKHTA